MSPTVFGSKRSAFGTEDGTAEAAAGGGGAGAGADAGGRAGAGGGEVNAVRDTLEAGELCDGGEEGWEGAVGGAEGKTADGNAGGSEGRCACGTGRSAVWCVCGGTSAEDTLGANGCWPVPREASGTMSAAEKADAAEDRGASSTKSGSSSAGADGRVVGCCGNVKLADGSDSAPVETPEETAAAPLDSACAPSCPEPSALVSSASNSCDSSRASSAVTLDGSAASSSPSCSPPAGPGVGVRPSRNALAMSAAFHLAYLIRSRFCKGRFSVSTLSASRRSFGRWSGPGLPRYRSLQRWPAARGSWPPPRTCAPSIWRTSPRQLLGDGW